MSLSIKTLSADQAFSLCQSLKDLGSLRKEHIVLKKSKNSSELTPVLARKSLCGFFYKPKEKRLVHMFNYLVNCFEKNQDALCDANYASKNLEVLLHIENYFSSKNKLQLWKLTRIREKLTSNVHQQPTTLFKTQQQAQETIRAAKDETVKLQERNIQLEKDKKEALSRAETVTNAMRASHKITYEMSLQFAEQQHDVIFKTGSTEKKFHSFILKTIWAKKEVLDQLSKATPQQPFIYDCTSQFTEKDLDALAQYMYQDHIYALTTMRLLKFLNYINTPSEILSKISELNELEMFGVLTQIGFEKSDSDAELFLSHFCDKAQPKAFLEGLKGIAVDNLKERIQSLLEKLAPSNGMARYYLAEFFILPINPTLAAYHYSIVISDFPNCSVAYMSNSKYNRISFNDFISLFDSSPSKKDCISDKEREHFKSLVLGPKFHTRFYRSFGICLFLKWPKKFGIEDNNSYDFLIKLKDKLKNSTNYESHGVCYVIGMCEIYGLSKKRYYDGIKTMIDCYNDNFNYGMNFITREMVRQRAEEVLKDLDKRDLRDFTSHDIIRKILLDYFESKQYVLEPDFDTPQTKAWVIEWKSFSDPIYAEKAKALANKYNW